MFVKSIIIPKHKVFSVKKGTPVGKALNLLREKQVDALPVLDGDTYLGIVTTWSIYEAGFNSELKNNSFLETVNVEEIVIKVHNTINEKAVFEETLVKVKDVPIIAVLDTNNKFIGIVTRFDVLEEFQSAFGMHRKGIRIAFSSIETEGRLAKLAKITSDFHQNIISLATFDETDRLVRRIVMKIEPTSDLEKYLERLEKNGFTVLDVQNTD